MTQRIFLDIDGVLADFIAGAACLHRQDPASVRTWDFFGQWGLTASDFWTPMGYDFWVNLPLTVEAREVVERCEKTVAPANVCLLTSPCETAGCLEGKRDWVRKHFPQFTRRCLIGAAKEFCASPESLLVDDHDKNCDAFTAAGGAACLFPRPWNANHSSANWPIVALQKALEEFRNGD